jgi:hypothetical protein
MIPDWVLGYNDLNHLALPGRWWLQNFILRHIYVIRFSEPFRPRLTSKFAKSANIIQKIFGQKCNTGIKKRWFRMCWKNCKKTFITVGKSFRPITSFGWTFLHCFQRIRTQHQIWRLMIPIFMLILALFANFKAKRGWNGWKNDKTYFINLTYNPILQPFLVWEAPYYKKVKIVILLLCKCIPAPPPSMPDVNNNEQKYWIVALLRAIPSNEDPSWKWFKKN